MDYDYHEANDNLKKIMLKKDLDQRKTLSMKNIIVIFEIL